MDPILFWGHFATVMFIIVFGITLGFVHYRRFFSSDRVRAVSRLKRRTRLVLICAIIVCVPGYVALWVHGPVKLVDLAFATYSPLNFYVLGLLSAPYWLMALGQRPLRNAFLLGLGYLGAAAILLAIWPGDSVLTITEYVRVNFVSGPYPYLQLSGVALMAIPAGVGLQRSLREGASWRFLLCLSVLGLVLAAIGWAWGCWAGEFDVHAIVDGSLRAPLRLWYWMFFAGPTLLLFAGLVALEQRSLASSKFMYSLALFGMGALPIYAGHTFVLPMLALFDRIVTIEGIGRIVLPFVIFAAYCLFVMQYYHRKLLDRTIISTSSA